MLNLPVETEQLARLVAIKSGKTPEDVIREAVERSAEAIGAEIAAMPLLDARAPEEIMDDLNSP
jgi:antitoxin VapB